jgi:hypothetical protein
MPVGDGVRAYLTVYAGSRSMRLGKGPVGVSGGRKVRGKRAFAGTTEPKGRTANRTWLSIFKDLFSTNNVGGDGGGKVLYMVTSWPCRLRVSFYLPQKWRVGRLINSSPSVVTRGIGNPTYERDNVAC